jgi:hypothetical protein
MSAFGHSIQGGNPMTEISELPPRERAKRYRELGREAAHQAANSKGEAQAAFVKFAGQWEQLALEAENDAKFGN